MTCLEIMLQCLYSYFAHVIKEFTKLVNIMATMENKILYNVKTRCILMLSLTKKYMVEYKNSLCEDGLEQPYKPSSYIELWILLLPPTFVWTCLHFAIVEIYACFFKFAQFKNLFVYNPMATINVLSRWCLQYVLWSNFRVHFWSSMAFKLGLEFNHENI